MGLTGIVFPEHFAGVAKSLIYGGVAYLFSFGIPDVWPRSQKYAAPEWR
jgi:hypothetical protein